MPKTLTWPENPLFPGFKSVEPVIESPWFPIIEDILGGKYPKKAEEIRYLIHLKKRATPANQTELHRFYQELLWGFGKVEDPYRLVAFMAQHHLYGWDWMYQMYSLIFSEEQVKKIYGFTRGVVYKGTEYPSFPMR